jgi:hypothetical protein
MFWPWRHKQYRAIHHSPQWHWKCLGPPSGRRSAGRAIAERLLRLGSRQSLFGQKLTLGLALSGESGSAQSGRFRPFLLGLEQLRHSRAGGQKSAMVVERIADGIHESAVALQPRREVRRALRVDEDEDAEFLAFRSERVKLRVGKIQLATLAPTATPRMPSFSMACSMLHGEIRQIHPGGAAGRYGPSQSARGTEMLLFLLTAGRVSVSKLTTCSCRISARAWSRSCCVATSLHSGVSSTLCWMPDKAARERADAPNRRQLHGFCTPAHRPQ